MTGRRRAAAFMLVTAAACAVVAALWQAGRWSATMDALTHFAPVVLAAGLVFILLCAWLDRRLWPALGVIGSVLLLSAGERIFPELAKRFAAEAPATGAPHFRVVQFNLRQRNIDPPATLAWIKAQRADVILLEEATGPSQVIVKALRRSYPYRSTCAGAPICPTLILSKVAPLDVGGLSRPPRPVRGAWAVLPSSNGPITVAAAHLTWPFPAGPQQMEASALAAGLDHLPKERMILTGDFNATPWSFFLGRLDRRLGLRRITHGQASFPARVDRTAFPVPLLAIDQAYVGSGWQVVDLRRGPRLGSDHYPLVIDLAPSAIR